MGRRGGGRDFEGPGGEDRRGEGRRGGGRGDFAEGLVGGRGVSGGGHQRERWDDLMDQRQEFRERLNDRLDRLDDRLDRMEERIERLEGRR
jgi:hypothetical protein